MKNRIISLAGSLMAGCVVLFLCTTAMAQFPAGYSTKTPSPKSPAVENKILPQLPNESAFAYYQRIGAVTPKVSAAASPIVQAPPRLKAESEFHYYNRITEFYKKQPATTPKQNGAQK
jgi:hypothetical protein